MFVDDVYLAARAQVARPHGLAVDGATLVGVVILSVALVLGLTTASHYGFTTDEFNTDEYGPKALAWYTSGFNDRSHFEIVEKYLWYYGPWAQILTAIAQSFNVVDPLTVRHAINFLVGWAALAALLPIARLTVGSWAGPVAVMLCLMTGYFYGGLFFTPIDVPFMAAMTWAVLGILLMTRHMVPTWPATFIAGLACGLAVATRPGGIISHGYLVGAMSLCALEAFAGYGVAAARPLAQIALRTVGALALAWMTAIVLWPWLQIGNPFTQFWIAYTHFFNLPASFELPHWGQLLWTNALPWHYVPGQLLARLPEGFLLLLAVGALFGIEAVASFARSAFVSFRSGSRGRFIESALALARTRGTLLVVAAATVPILFAVVGRPTLYDGIRHLTFVIPMLAILAAAAFLQLLTRLRRFPAVVATIAVVAALHLGLTILTLAKLHPLEYVAMNSLAGGTAGAAGRFELDYWGAAASEALRQLERRLDADTSGRFASQPPRVFVCIVHRAAAAGMLFRRPWQLVLEASKADFIIETERWKCAEGSGATLIDEVRRLDTPFAWIYANNRGRT